MLTVKIPQYDFGYREQFTIYTDGRQLNVKDLTGYKAYLTVWDDTTAENAALKKETASLEAALDARKHKSIQKQLQEAQLHREYQQAKALLDRIPKEVLDMYKRPRSQNREDKGHEAV